MVLIAFVLSLSNRISIELLLSLCGTAIEVMLLLFFFAIDAHAAELITS